MLKRTGTHWDDALVPDFNQLLTAEKAWGYLPSASINLDWGKLINLK